MTLRALCTAGALITVGMLIGRFLGLLRESLIAAHYGTANAADMAISLLLIPDFIASLLIGSAVSAVMVPAFTALEGPRAQALFWQAIALNMLVFSAASLIAYTQLDGLALLLHGTPDAGASRALLFALMSLPLTGANAVVTAWLQYRGKLLVPAFSNALFNAVIVATLWFAPAGLAVLGMGVLVAAFVRLAANISAYAGNGGGLWGRGVGWQVSGSLLKHYITTVAGGFFQLVPHYAPYVVMALSAAGIALFNYAFKLVLLPAMLLMTIIQMAILPWFSRMLRDGAADTAYALAFRVAVLLAFSMTLAMTLASRQIVSLCFGYGEMTSADIESVSRLFALGVWALPGMVAGSVWQQLCYAHRRPQVPLKVSMIQAFAMVPLVWLGQAQEGVAGVILAYVAVQWLSPLLFGLRSLRGGLLPQGMGWPRCIMPLLASFAAFLPMAALFVWINPGPVAGFSGALCIGGLTLAAGLAAEPACRDYALKRVRPI